MTFVHQGCTGLIRELQDYATHSNNLYHLRRNLQSLGFEITGRKITVLKEGALRSEPEGMIPIIEKGYRKSESWGR